MIKPLLLLAAIWAAGAATGGDSVIELSFGGAPGTGRMQLRASPSGEIVVFGVGTEGAADVLLQAQHSRPDGYFDNVAMSLQAPAPGRSLEISDACGSNDACAEVTVLFGSSGSGEGSGWRCQMDAGTVQVAALTATRATGTFAGSGTCTGPEDQSEPFAVKDGRFDVPIQSP